jgi:hypothetical protein
MEEIHPSLDASLVKKPKVESATEVIVNELDLLNLKYQLLADTLYHRLQYLSSASKQEDPNFDVSFTPEPEIFYLLVPRTRINVSNRSSFQFSISQVPAPSPIRTYRFSSRDSTPLR